MIISLKKCYNNNTPKKERKNNMVILYSNNCPRCRILKSQLDRKGIKYEVSDDFTKLIEAKIMSAPVLEVNGQLLTFDEAMKY